MAKSAPSSDATRRMIVVFGACLALWSMGWAEDAAKPDTVSLLDQGFSGLYNLDFAGARNDFTAWETEHPGNPVGPVSEAAGFLFSEFNRLGVLEGQFFENDETFAARSKLSPDPVVHGHFQNALDHAQQLAHARLSKDAKDRDAL